MLRFENFLCCLKLETGGYVVGWLTLILNALSLIALLMGVVGLGVHSCEDIAEILSKNMNEENLKMFTEYCPTGKTLFIICLIVAALFAFGFALIGWMCVAGTTNRNHNKIKPMVILLAVSTVLALVNILTFTSTGIVGGLFNALFYGYLFVCIYSLFYNIRDEFERGFTSQYRAPPAKA